MLARMSSAVFDQENELRCGVVNYGAKQRADQGVPSVPRGITENDVFTACDALLCTFGTLGAG